MAKKKEITIKEKSHNDVTEQFLRECYDERNATDRIINDLEYQLAVAREALVDIERDINDMMSKKMSVIEIEIETKDATFVIGEHKTNVNKDLPVTEDKL